MGDMGEIFNEWREQKTAKRSENTAFSTNLLREKGIKFEAKNGGSHLVVNGKHGIADFWPSTGLWIIRSATNPKMRGVHNLIIWAGVSAGCTGAGIAAVEELEA